MQWNSAIRPLQYGKITQLSWPIYFGKSKIHLPFYLVRFWWSDGLLQLSSSNVLLCLPGFSFFFFLSRTFFGGVVWPKRLSLRPFVFLQIQNLLKRLETPYNDDADIDAASLSQKEAKEAADSSCLSHQCPTLFNFSDGHETYPDKPPDDALNMRLT